MEWIKCSEECPKPNEPLTIKGIESFETCAFDVNTIAVGMKWIKCSDRLPEKSGRYLVFEEKKPHSHNCAAYNYPIACCESNIAYFRCFQSKDWEWNSFDQNNCSPTHWMPLPNSPKE